MENYDLNITTPSAFAKTTVFDSKDNIVSIESGFQVNLHKQPKGIYTIRVELDGMIKEETVLHKDQHTQIHLAPTYYTSALLEGAASSYEYYTEPAQVVSQQIVASHNQDATAGLFIFLRFPTSEMYQRHAQEEPEVIGRFADQFRLLNADFQPLEYDGVWKTGVSAGWLGKVIRHMPGLVYLVYLKENRCIPLYLFEGWQTQVFMTLAKEPIFGSMRLMMAHLHAGFSASDAVARAVDHTLSRLLNRRYTIPTAIERMLLDSKFENPLLGLLWAYAYLLGRREDKPLLLEQVLNNLEQSLFKSNDFPDMQFLRYLFNRYVFHRVEVKPITAPLLFSFSYDRLVEEAILEPALVVEGSQADLIATRLFLDSAITSWESPELAELADLQFPTVRWTGSGSVALPTGSSLGEQGKADDPQVNKSGPPAQPPHGLFGDRVSERGSGSYLHRMIPDKDDFDENLHKSIRRISLDLSSQAPPSWEKIVLARAIDHAKHAGDEEQFSLESLSRQISLPYNTVKRILTTLKFETTNNAGAYHFLHQKGMMKISQQEFLQELQGLIEPDVTGSEPIREPGPVA
jgi:hypothetical protein